MAKAKQFEKIKKRMQNDDEINSEIGADGFEDVDDFFDSFNTLEELSSAAEKAIVLSDSTIEIKSVKKENAISIEEYKARKKKEMAGKYTQIMRSAKINKNSTTTGTGGVIDSPDTLINFLVEYCLYCETNTIPFTTAKGIMYDKLQPLPKTMVGFASFIGVCTDYVYKILRLPQYRDVGVLIHQEFEKSTLEMGATGEMDQRLAQFLLNVTYGYQATQQVEVNVNATMKIEQLAKDAAKGMLNKGVDIQDVEFIEAKDVTGDDEDE